MSFSEIGQHTYGIFNARIHGLHGDIRVGKYCYLADCVFFALRKHHAEWASTHPFGAFAKWSTVHGQDMTTSQDGIIVGNDVWIGHHATISAGVTIGDGAIIAANSHVVRDVPPYAIVEGNPAQVIRMRFPDEIIQRFLELRWWDLPDEAVNRLAPGLCSPDIHELLDELQNERQAQDTV